MAISMLTADPSPPVPISIERARRVGGSLAIVLAMYFLYSLLVVRWIEPGVQRSSESNQDFGNANKDFVEERLKQFAGLFPPGSWALKNPKILESDRATLLLQEYRTMSDGWVEITPCAIVFPYEGPAEDEQQRRRQSIILEVPAGALLKFDQGLNLAQARMGRLIGGQLRGKVTIRSDWKEPGPEDDLCMETEDIRLTDRTVTTANPVSFRWGPHFGNGRDMVIKLLAAPPKRGASANGPNISGVDTFEIRHVERLHLDLGQTGAMGQKAAEKVPIEISCRGPFVFDVTKRVATFRDRVDVTKQNATGPADQIACEVLALFFSEDDQKQKASGSAGRRAADSFSLKAERLEAKGNPVVITAPSQQATARGPRVEYNLVTRSILLDGGPEVFLRQLNNEIHASSLSYQAGENGRMGRVAAAGPGWLRGQSADRPDQQLEAVWKDQLTVTPQEHYQVISLTGGAELKFPGMGQLQAREIFFWLHETPPASEGATSRLRPDRMLARNDVHMNSPQLSGKVEQMEVWFQEVPNQAAPPVAGAPTSVAGPSRVYAPAPVPAQQPLLPRQSAQQRFEVTGRLLRAQLLLGGPQPGVNALLLQDGAQFVETQTALPGERPLLIRGDRLELNEASGPNSTVTVVGRPARFEARGLGLTATNINVHRGENRMWIDGPGQMDLPLSGGMPGMGNLPTSPAAGTTPGVLTVDWRKGMEFNGARARFEESVVAVGTQQQARTELRTEVLEVRMQRPIRFAESQSSEPPRVEHIQCLGGVSIENRSLDWQQQLQAIDRMQLLDLGINVLSGELTGGGPGWFNSVRRGSTTVAGPAPVAPVSLQAAPAKQDQMICLNVRFAKSISGNVLRHRLTFHEQVRAAYGPAGGWDTVLATDNPDKLGPGGMAARCEQLSVGEVAQPLGDRRAMEMDAIGNSVVEGTTYSARGNRISYSQAKELLMLEGDGRNDAELFQQPQPGAPANNMRAQKIQYWLKTKQIKIDNAQSFQLSPIPNGNPMSMPNFPARPVGR